MNDNQKYHADTSRASKSSLDLIHQAPAKYHAKYLDPNAPKPEQKNYFNFGSAFHCAVLEPELFRNEYIVAPSFSGVGSVAKKQEFDQVNHDKKQISLADYQKIQGMAESVKGNPKIARLLSSGEAEKQFNWIDTVTGARCKCKPDWITPDGYIVDLKSTDDASDEGFKRSARKYRYFVQDAFYTDGVEANGIEVKGFIFVAVEKGYPYLSNSFIYPDSEQEIGRETYRDDLQLWLKCQETGIYEGYGNDIKNLEIW